MENKKIIALVLALSLGTGGISYSYASQPKDIDIIINNKKIEEKIKGRTVKDVLNNVDFYNFNSHDKISHDLSDKAENNMTIKIDTEKTFSLNNKKIKTTANTLKEYFDENNIKYMTKDSLNYDINSPLRDNLNIVYQPHKEKNITREEDIPFNSKKVYDFNFKVGDKHKEEGKKGKKEVKLQKITDKGKTDIKTLSEKIISEPKDEIIHIGTRVEEKEEIPFKIITQEDNTLEQGREIIDREGKNGEKKVIYEKINDDLNKKEEKISKKPINKIIRIGTKSELGETPTSTTSIEDDQTYNAKTNWAKEWIAQRESGGSYSAYNSSSGCYGRYQLSPQLINYGASPADQEKVADNYVSKRYGSWENAQKFWVAHNWY